MVQTKKFTMTKPRYLTRWLAYTILALALPAMCRSDAHAANLLLVVANPNSLQSQEAARRSLFESWGYSVQLIDDGASQANFDSAAFSNDVAYIPSTVSDNSVDDKLRNFSIGVVNEHPDLVDELGLANTGYASHGTTELRVENGSHYITYGASPGTTLPILSSQQNLYRRTNGIASGAVNLAEVYRTAGQQGPGIFAIDVGGSLYGGGSAAGRRVQLPFGSSNFNFNALNMYGELAVQRSIEWAARPNPSLGELLMVVGSSYNPSSEDVKRRMLFDVWGWDVALLDDDASQSSYNGAVNSNDVVYLATSCNSASVGTKLRGAAIGIVNEEAELADELGFATGVTFGSNTSLNVVVGENYITQPFGLGAVSLFYYATSDSSLAGDLAPGLVVLGQWGSAPSLATIEAGSELVNEIDGNLLAAGRRAYVPWAAGGFQIDSLTLDGKTLMRRTIEWAAALVGHWRFDETSGTTAYDTSGYRNHGTLYGGFSFASDGLDSSKIVHGLTFNGSSDYVDVSSSNSLRPTRALTMSAWVKATAWGSGDNANAIIRKGDNNPNNYQLSVADGRLTLQLDDYDAGGFRGDTVLQTGRWYHLAATWDGAVVRLYVNGELDNSPGDYHAAPIGADNRSLYLGGRPWSDYFAGTLDDLRLYNYALSPDEIEALHGQGQALGIRIIRWLEVK